MMFSPWRKALADMMRGALAFCALFAVVSPVSAQTSCSASARFSYDFTTQATASLSYSSTYNWTATNGLSGTQPFTVGFTTDGVSSTTVASLSMPRIDTLVNDGGTTARNLIIGQTFTGRTTSITGSTRVVVTNFTFPTPVREFSVQLNDIDFASNQFRDWIHISGANGASSYIPAIITPFSTDNGSGAKTSGSSSMQLGASTSPLTVGVSEALGTGESGNNANTGTLTASFAQPVTSVSIRYGNSNQSTGGSTTGQQAYGIQWIRFCPMPVINAVKTSAVVSDGVNTNNPKAIPGALVDYTITVTNSGGSTVDISSANIADILPANVTFFNGDIDTATAGTQNFVFNAGTSGLTLGAANVTYSNNGGASYTYTPTAGYDTNVNAVRFLPQGTMAANSSFTVRIRTQVK